MKDAGASDPRASPRRLAYQGRNRERPTADPDLVLRAREGERGAFEALYREHVGRVFALCLRLAADEARALELTQDVFVRVWEKLGTFRGDSAFPTWLHRVAVNVVYHDIRGAERRARRESEAAPGGSTADAPEARLDLERAIAALPPRARTVFVLHDVEGYTHVEIGEMTGIAAGTSKAHLHRAHRLLRRSLAG